MNTTATRCCGTSVGARVRRRTNNGWEYLLIGRAWWPIGQAPVAGHVYDAHTDVIDALVAEMHEEVGLEVVSYELLHEVRLTNLCMSLPAAPVAGHHWWLYDVEASGELHPDPEETTGARWVSAAELQRLADITTFHALAGRPARTLPHEALEAVWVTHFAATGDIRATPAALGAVERLYSTPPDEYWLG
ncbi:NUDIX hydrolase [Nocardiopsis sp. CT-R113]|uniref:NUDIX hydrolase n=1 Tax=Nocardiopsis codii TaxID=3065942 RepID=A0ABU7K1J8_9ACTN|nr:NUDIX hydrolase [Nocardiopsis sp. CT-R113]MEE2036116.1 NUDIX hydrolase [Nocardiopsis sp. CT-R113]